MSEIDILISVVIPTYNRADFLQAALNSVLCQTYQNWEIIVVDNNSIDDTEKIVTSFNNDKIKLIKVNNYSVIGYSRNVGIKQSKGDWVAFLDSDDIWYPKKLERIVAVIKNMNIDVVCHDEMLVNTLMNYKKILRHGSCAKNLHEDLVLSGNCLSLSAASVRREFIIKQNIYFSELNDHIAIEDYIFWLQLASVKAIFKFIHEILGEYMVHGSNVTIINNYGHREKLNKFLHWYLYNMSCFSLLKDKMWQDICFQNKIFQLRCIEQNLKFFSLLLIMFGSPICFGRILWRFLKKKVMLAYEIRCL